jgi:uncharacterized cupredoxin-like copper-binding protein
MSIRKYLIISGTFATLALSPAALAQGGHAGHDMGGMHEELAAKLMDTSAFGEKGDPANAARTVKIAGEEIRYDVTALNVQAGETITFAFTNKGEQPHELTIGDTAYLEAAREMMAMMAEMGMDMGSPEHAGMHKMTGNTIMVAPGETGSITWHFTKPGDFFFACNFVGHSEAGMLGTIAVR